MKTKECGKKLISVFLTPIIYIYFIGLLIFAPYFNWQYAKDNGFVKWIFLGEVIASAKAFIWPYYLINIFADNNKSHLTASLEYHGKANKLLFSLEAPSTIPPEIAAEIVNLRKKALLEAELVDIKKLNTISPEFATHYQEEFIKGLKLIKEGRETSDAQKDIEGQFLIMTFDNWYWDKQDKYYPD